MVSKHVALFVASLVVGVSTPLYTTALYRYEGMPLHEAAGTVTTVKRYTPVQRGDLRKALAIYQTLLQMGEVGIVKPTLEDPETIQVYLDAYPDGLRYDKPIEKNPITTTDYVAPADAGSSRDMSDLDRADFRRALRTRTCYVSLPTGLRELCEEMVKGRKPREIKGLTNPYAR